MPDNDATVNRIPWIVWILVLLALAGGGYLLFRPSRDSPDPEAAIRQVATTAFTSEDPQQCEQLFTGAFVKAAFSDAGGDPLERCHELYPVDPNPDPNRVTISKVTINGSTARVEAHWTGGEYGVADMALRMTDQDGWRVDAITQLSIVHSAFAKLLRERERSEDAEAGAASHLTKRFSSCFYDEAVAPASIERIERATVHAFDGGRPGPSNTDNYLGNCGKEFREAVFSVVAIADKASLPPGQAKCVADAASRATSRAELEDIARAAFNHEPSPSSFSRIREAALAVCSGATSS